MSTDPNAIPTPPPTPTPATNQVTVGDMGLKGLVGIVGNTTAMVVIAVSFLMLQHQMMNWGRTDRQEDRQLFRESLKDIQDEGNRRTGEIKGAMDAMNGATRELTNEIKSWRQGMQKAKPPDAPGPGGASRGTKGYRGYASVEEFNRAADSWVGGSS